MDNVPTPDIREIPQGAGFSSNPTREGVPRMTPETVHETPVETAPGNPAVVLIGLDSALRARFQRYFTQRHYRIEFAANGTCCRSCPPRAAG
jgi:hypothetical protein